MALEHGNVIQLSQVIETIHNVYLIMEHAGGGQLQCHILEAGGMQEEKICRVFRQMVHVMYWLRPSKQTPARSTSRSTTTFLCPSAHLPETSETLFPGTLPPTLLFYGIAEMVLNTFLFLQII